jgi:hypothetical protein
MNVTGELSFLVQNNSTGSAVLEAMVSGTSTTAGLGPYFRSNINGVQTWVFGCDPNAGNNFKIAPGFNFSVPAILSITPAGEVDVIGSFHVDGNVAIGAVIDPNTLLSAQANAYDPTATTNGVYAGRTVVLSADNINTITW